MRGTDPYDEVQREPGAGEERERGSPAEPLPPPIDGDLWSAPASAVPVDGGLLADGMLRSSDAQATLGAPPVNAEDGVTSRDLDRGRRVLWRADQRGRRRSSGVALVIAVAILIGLGFTARQLDPPLGSKPDPSSDPRPVPVTSASSGVSPGGRSEVDTGGSKDCPMRLKSSEQPTRSSPAGRSHCFFIE